MSPRSDLMTTPLSGRRARWLALGVLVALSAPVVALALATQDDGGRLVRADLAAIEAATAVTRSAPPLRQVLLLWQELFQARWVNLVAWLVCLWVWHRRGLAARALWAAVTIVAIWNLALGLKFLVARARPLLEEAIDVAPGYSFPSGHTTNAAATGLTLTLLLWPLLRRRGRAIAGVVLGAVVALTALDRVYLGVHYPSDVVAGALLGFGLAAASYLLYLGIRTPAGPRRDHEIGRR